MRNDLEFINDWNSDIDVGEKYQLDLDGLVREIAYFRKQGFSLRDRQLLVREDALSLINEFNKKLWEEYRVRRILR